MQKVIFKIEEYLPETGQIVIRMCNKYSHKPITEYECYAIDCDNIDLYDAESFFSSLMKNYGSGIIEGQDNIILDENKSEIISGKFNIEDLVDRIIECKIYDNRKSILKMRKVEL